MFIIDDLLLNLPAQGLMGIFKRIHELAEKEMNQGTAIKTELRKIQMQLDLGLLTETEFEKKERILLKELSRIYQPKRIGRKGTNSRENRI